MPVVRIPSVLRKHTAGEAKVTASGATVREVFDDLVARHPGLGDQLLEGGEVRGFVNVYVADEDIRYLQGLDTPVADDDEVAIMPAVAGGCGGLQPPTRSGGCGGLVPEPGCARMGGRRWPRVRARPGVDG